MWDATIGIDGKKPHWLAKTFYNSKIGLFSVPLTQPKYLCERRIQYVFFLYDSAIETFGSIVHEYKVKHRNLS